MRLWTKSGPVGVLIDGHFWERESEPGRDAMWRHCYGWCLGRTVVNRNHQPQGSLGSPIQGGKTPRGTSHQRWPQPLLIAWPASCLSPSSTSSIAPGSHGLLPIHGALGREAEGLQATERGWGLLMGIVLHTHQVPEGLWVHPMSTASLDLHMRCACSLPSVSDPGRAWACGHNRAEKSLCQQIWKCSISSSLSLTHSLAYKMDIETTDLFYHASTPRKIQWYHIPLDAHTLFKGRGSSLHMYKGQTKIGNMSKVVASFCNQLL